MPRTELVAAIQAFTHYVRRPSHTPAEDTHGPQRTEKQLADWRSRVEAICSKMDAVADCPLSTLSEFEALRREMGTEFPATPPALLNRVADAFLHRGSADAGPLIVTEPEMPSTFSLHKIDEAIRDLEEKAAHGAEISREELASGILRITKRLRDELEAAVTVIDSLKDHTGLTVAASRPKQRER
ncbi:hypothetical protein J4G48_0049055 (plasmid) [Bradyrhizobium barranii subsp. apii]|uniref:hypothetical protein n=1 Tax=Bradyrhizobium barranii TaxID=2992140 RepID=UPI001CD4A34F|nr:hypothetical protein [Bradyrhizobium barranii]UPU01376.1 hypothetical protein J4G48_0049055 [Bradyrhizobium barranii subsp. apii]